VAPVISTVASLKARFTDSVRPRVSGAAAGARGPAAGGSATHSPVPACEASTSSVAVALLLSRARAFSASRCFRSACAGAPMSHASALRSTSKPAPRARATLSDAAGAARRGQGAAAHCPAGQHPPTRVMWVRLREQPTLSPSGPLPQVCARPDSLRAARAARRAGRPLSAIQG